MVIDSHVHLYRNPKDLDRIVNSGIVEQAWIMDVQPIHPSGLSSVEFASPEEIIEVAREYKGFFIPFGFLDFRKGSEIVNELHSKGFVGLKAIRPAKPYDDPSYFPYYERAEKLNMPILFHTGIIAHATQKQTGEGLSLGPTNMRPSMLQTIAAAFPKLTIIGGHTGFPWQEETFWNIWYYSNIYHDTSGGDFVPLLEWLLKILNYRDYQGKAFTEKILFATDAYYGRKESHDHVFREINFWKELFEKVSPYFHWKGEEENIMYLNAKVIMDRILKSL